MNKLDAYKMDGLGNDFIIFDKRKKSISLTKDQIIKISDRGNIGCDQVIFIDNDKSSNAYLTFYNSDGGEIAACGNGSRCAAYLLMKENNNKKISLRTKVGILQAELDDKNLVRINMGQPNFKWEKIPLSKEMDNKNLKIKINSTDGKEIEGGFSLSVGNPHIIFFVEDFNKFNLKEIGPKIENHNYFPERCNVTLASIKNKKYVKVKVWERGAGLTLACGSGACAALVASHRRGKCARRAYLIVDGGELIIEWRQTDGHVLMSGGVATAFSGILDESLAALVQRSPT